MVSLITVSSSDRSLFLHRGSAVADFKPHWSSIGVVSNLSSLNVSISVFLLIDGFSGSLVTLLSSNGIQLELFWAHAAPSCGTSCSSHGGRHQQGSCRFFLNQMALAGGRFLDLTSESKLKLSDGDPLQELYWTAAMETDDLLVNLGWFSMSYFCLMEVRFGHHQCVKTQMDVFLQLLFLHPHSSDVIYIYSFFIKVPYSAVLIPIRIYQQWLLTPSGDGWMGSAWSLKVRSGIDAYVSRTSWKLGTWQFKTTVKIWKSGKAGHGSFKGKKLNKNQWSRSKYVFKF